MVRATLLSPEVQPLRWCRMIREILVATAVAASAIAVAPPASAGPWEDLIRMLPAGYGPDVCQPAPMTPEMETILLAALNCGPNSLPGGPIDGHYQLYRDVSKMMKVFTKMAKDPERTMLACPGGPPRPLEWQVGDRVLGTVSCATSRGQSNVFWSREDLAPFAASVYAPDLDSLYRWWATTGTQGGGPPG